MEERRGKRGLRGTRQSDRAEDERGARAGASGSGGGGIFKSAAVAVLRQHRKLMTTGDITRLAVEMGLLKCQGKTPEATMASALYTDVKRKLHKSLFTRPQEGLFGLREWIEEGYYPEGWVGPPDGLGLAPFKRRNAPGQYGGSSPGPSSLPKGGHGRQGVRTGPGRSSKARAARSWRSATSDEEDEDMLDDDDDDPMVSTPPSATAAAAVRRLAGDEDDGDEAMGDEGDDGDGDEEPDEGEYGGGEEGDSPAEGGADGVRRHSGADDEHQPQASTRGTPPPQPTSSAMGRRSGRGRSAGGGAEGGMHRQDECMSPLLMLGEAAASESAGDMAADHGTPPSKRKRPSSITVPDRVGGLGGVEGVGAVTPKSPYEDRLAALHEVATSPCTFELTSQREARERDTAAVVSGGRGGSGQADAAGGSGGGRQRPRLHVEVPGQTLEAGTGGTGSRAGTPGSVILADNPMMQGETTPAILIQASPVTTSNGQQAMLLRQAPVLVTLPPSLASPRGPMVGSAANMTGPGSGVGPTPDTPALVHVQLPGGTPTEQLVQTTVISPTGHLLRSGGQLGGRGGLLKAEGGTSTSRAPGRRVSFSGQVGILGPPPTTGPTQLQSLLPGRPSATGFSTPGSGGPGASAASTPSAGQWPPRLSASQVEAELTEITRMQTVVERLESKLGASNPQVGKAWLALGRMYQHAAEAENHLHCGAPGAGAASLGRATEALKRAWAALRSLAEGCGTMATCNAAFEYLISRSTEEAAKAAAGSASRASPELQPVKADGEAAVAEHSGQQGGMAADQQEDGGAQGIGSVAAGTAQAAGAQVTDISASTAADVEMREAGVMDSSAVIHTKGEATAGQHDVSAQVLSNEGPS